MWPIPVGMHAEQAAAVGRALVARGLSLAVAESCTGGLLGACISRVAGCSRYFLGGVIAYDNAVKTALLDVREVTLARGGAVSAAVAGEMAAGVARRVGADVGVAVTGVAGPAGGTAAKPVGLVYVAVARGARRTVRECRFAGSREQVRRAAVAAALELVLQCAEAGRAPTKGTHQGGSRHGKKGR